MARGGQRSALRGLAAAFVLCAGVLYASDPPKTPVDHSVFDEAWLKVKGLFYDQRMHGVDWVAIREKYRPLAKKARTARELHDVINLMFGELKVSHTVVIEAPYRKRYYLQGAVGRPVPEYGLQLVDLEQGLFVKHVLPGSPAASAGVRRGDRLVAINGVPPRRSELMPAPYEACYQGPRAYVLYPEKTGEQVDLALQRTPRPLGRYAVKLRAHGWNQTEAGRHGARIVERSGFKLGYYHIYHLLDHQPANLLIDWIVKHRDEVDGMVIDLRGTGGFPKYADRVLDLFDPGRIAPIREAKNGRIYRAGPSKPLFGKPVVALIDAGARSVKELLAFEWRRRKIGPLVGQTTRGALLGASFGFDLGDGAGLMVALMDMRATHGGITIEQHGVAPDVVVKTSLPYANGRDEIEDAGFDVLLDEVLASRRAHTTKRKGWY